MAEPRSSNRGCRLHPLPRWSHTTSGDCPRIERGLCLSGDRFCRDNAQTTINAQSGTELSGHHRDACRLNVAHQGIGDLVDGVHFFQMLGYQHLEVVLGRSKNLAAALFMTTLKPVHLGICHVNIVRRL